ncbi:hypothetical protein PRIPAC_85377 [Pristionchus pacificus]|uniref:Uncharacterized protein n=1 Tax=Pristionchus pacificus TaxID=54126 RepID=A0A2A6BKR1_PRIPA|nr:hypothetical protein PRIPAC_85377 [Pristionchus pacificus]|eukprot:PDM66505.1 hypothetical protein PRIPAC_47922 [Pristionchus pacificus]
MSPHLELVDLAHHIGVQLVDVVADHLPASCVASSLKSEEGPDTEKMVKKALKFFIAVSHAKMDSKERNTGCRSKRPARAIDVEETCDVLSDATWRTGTLPRHLKAIRPIRRRQRRKEKKLGKKGMNGVRNEEEKKEEEGEDEESEDSQPTRGRKRGGSQQENGRVANGHSPTSSEGDSADSTVSRTKGEELVKKGMNGVRNEEEKKEPNSTKISDAALTGFKLLCSHGEKYECMGRASFFPNPPSWAVNGNCILFNPWAAASILAILVCMTIQLAGFLG